jgi:23S rRNA (uracil1939-C5)-methyltransferase
MQDSFYKNWQIEMIKNILAQNGLNAEVNHVFQAEKNSRRRAIFHICHEEDGVKVGFYNSFSQNVECISDCLILDAKLKEIIPELEELFIKILKPRKKAEASVTLCENGLDILLKFPKKLKTSAKEVLADYSDNKWVRLATQITDDEPTTVLWQKEEPCVKFGKTLVPVAIGGFLQATKSGEKAIVSAVIDGVSSSDNILELFAGNGTLTLPLLENGKAVTAVELNSDSLRMLKKGAKEYANNLSIVEKNLFTESYSTNELNNFDCVVLDPPRAGAKKQIEVISTTKIPKIVMASCNIKTFAQDSRILVDAGYDLENISIIDQFLWTPHVEVVGIFTR